MQFPSFQGILDVKDLTKDKYNKDFLAIRNWWNEHDQGLRPWTVSYAQNLVLQTVIFTSSGNYAATPADVVIVINKSVGGATTVTLPVLPQMGRTIVIKDGKGDAAANNITVQGAAGNIDGSGTYVMNANYRGLTLVYNGTQWNKISLF
jgi:hypothetical protein